MTDVRLTATNPEDSSVVPVACNSKGELLVTEPVIEAINNDVTITGRLLAGTEDSPGVSTINGVRFFSTKGTVVSPVREDGSTAWALRDDGYANFNRANADGYGSVGINDNLKALSVYNSDGARVWSVDPNGVTEVPSLVLQLEPDNPLNFKTGSDGETTTSEYIGPQLDVLQALVALKTEVQRLEEKLNMTPTAGWEVWDGSAKTPES